MGNEYIDLDIYFSVRNDAGREIVHVTRPQTKCVPVLGLANFAKCSTLLNCMIMDGTLTVEIRMRRSQPRHLENLYIPSNPFSKKLHQLFMEEQSADVIFQVVGGNKVLLILTRWRRWHQPTFMHTDSSCGLRKSASSMAEICGEEGGESMTVVPINDIKPKIFKRVLYFVYGGVYQKKSRDEC